MRRNQDDEHWLTQFVQVRRRLNAIAKPGDKAGHRDHDHLDIKGPMPQLCRTFQQLWSGMCRLWHPAPQAQDQTPYRNHQNQQPRADMAQRHQLTARDPGFAQGARSVPDRPAKDKLTSDQTCQTPVQRELGERMALGRDMISPYRSTLLTGR